MTTSAEQLTLLEKWPDPADGSGRSQVVCTVRRGYGVMGYVVIDSTIGGHSSGGLRLVPDLDEAEVSELAHAMTLKYGFLGMPQGGAKAGVIGDFEAPQSERRERLADFAQAIAPLLRNRIYLPGADIGTDNSDIRHMLESVGVRIKRREFRGNRPGYYTALTVFTGAREAARHLGLRLSECSVAIEGFGKVGSALAGLMDGAGARVVAISTASGAIFNPHGMDVRLLTSLAAEAGSRVVDLYPDAQPISQSALLELPVDVLCPCARNGSLHSGNAHAIQARIIAAGANNPVVPDAEPVLFERGIVCLPDFVTNCGGVLGGRMELATIAPHQIASFVEQHIGASIASLLQESTRKRVQPREIAVPIALSRFEQVRRNVSRRSPRQELLQAALELHRRGWLPSAVVRPLSLVFFERMLSGPSGMPD